MRPVNSTILRKADDPRSICVARYKTSTAQPIAHNTPVVINFDTKVVDTHDAVTVGVNWRFAAPYTMAVFGKMAALLAPSNAWTVEEYAYAGLRLNGVLDEYLSFRDNDNTAAGARFTQTLGGPFALKLEAGQYIDFVIFQISDVEQALHNNSYHNRFELIGIPM